MEDRLAVLRTWLGYHPLANLPEAPPRLANGMLAAVPGDALATGTRR